MLTKQEISLKLKLLDVPWTTVAKLAGTPVSFELGSWNGKTVGKSVRPMIDDAASETEVRDGRG
jgi:hypothetical protein